MFKIIQTTLAVLSITWPAGHCWPIGVKLLAHEKRNFHIEVGPLPLCGKNSNFRSKISTFCLKILNFRSKISTFCLKILNFRSKISTFRLKILNFRSKISDFLFKVQNFNFCLKIWIFRLSFRTFRSKISDFCLKIEIFVQKSQFFVTRTGVFHFRSWPSAPRGSKFSPTRKSGIRYLPTLDKQRYFKSIQNFWTEILFIQCR
jgi:hypothetical protein